uniref:Solute carrier organic anion transporter family member n=1 Tax=Chelonoidis abingdonii TaxID=106734 RepID=A0A8C0G8R0_CHEAB
MSRIWRVGKKCFFVFCHGFLQLSQLLLSSYLKSSISTIEKRFGLSSQTSGLLASFNEVGNTLLIVFVSYFGSRVNRPRFIGCGAILVSIAGFLMSLPHFITGHYEYDQSIARILFALTVIGPGVAFMLGSAILRFYVDIDKVSPEEIQLTNKDPRWVGAWWLGFLVAATLVALSAIPYFFFPKEMPKEVRIGMEIARQIEGSADSRGTSIASSISFFPVVLLRNLRHPVYLLVVLAQVNLSAMVAGLATFMGKFLERQFSLTASFANMIIGSVNIPGAIVGIVAGGAIMKKFQMTLKQCGGMCVIGMLLCVIFAFPLLFLGCPTQKVAGLNYRRSSDVGPHSFECNSKCNCLDKAYNPICGADGIEYISPCFAGSSSLLSFQNYTNCRCISTNGAEGSASPGTCGTNCSHLLLPFVVLSCLAGILASTSHTPSFMLILRSVQPEDKSFAVGIQFLLLRILAWMPGPVLYGSAIDTTCILWEKKCKKNAACRYYDNDLFRQRYRPIWGKGLGHLVICFPI